MKVKDLIAFLERYDPNMVVGVSVDDGYYEPVEKIETIQEAANKWFCAKMYLTEGLGPVNIVLVSKSQEEAA